MEIIQAPIAYRPVTIVLETQDDFDKFAAIVQAVAANRIQHAPRLIEAAREFADALECLEGN